MRHNGEIVRLVEARGFGFIRDGNTHMEYFFHARDIFDGHLFAALRVGMQVSFLPAKTDKGWRAQNVEVV